MLVTQSCSALCSPVDIAHQSPLSTGSSRQEYWSGLPFPSPGYLPDPGSNVISCIAGRLVPRRTRNLEEAHFSVPLSCHHHMQWFFTVTLTVFLVAAACAALQMLYTPGPPSMLCQRDSSMSGAPTLPHRLESQHHRRVNEKRGIFSPYFPQFQCARILVTGAQL